MDKSERPGFLEMFRTFWPVLLFILGVAVWSVQEQTALEIRVAVIEEQMPDKKMMQELYARLASVETELKQLSTAIVRMENLLFEQYRGK